MLAVPALSRSAHFALHHVAASSDLREMAESQPRPDKLSTTGSDNCQGPVDKTHSTIRFGILVPKRHARRAVTRNLVKRLGREAMRAHAQTLPAGLWLLRLRAGLTLGQFVSARSAALAAALRLELDRLLRGARERCASAQPAMRAGAHT
ncbi:MAG: ribonuclease P protein component [Comamonadaceae bacterium]|nr:ribonuclease P protein component [Comamonadaceae bacterium]